MNCPAMITTIAQTPTASPATIETQTATPPRIASRSTPASTATATRTTIETGRPIGTMTVSLAPIASPRIPN